MGPRAYNLLKEHRHKKSPLLRALNGRGGGIRTHDTLSRMPVFKTGAFDHSATPPRTTRFAVGAQSELFPEKMQEKCTPK